MLPCSTMVTLFLRVRVKWSCQADEDEAKKAKDEVELKELQDCPLVLFQKESLPSNLHELEIRNCNQLTPQVDWGLQRLASLTRLSIECGCEDVDLFPNKHLLPSSLTSLVISKLPNLKSLNNKRLQQLTSLLKLEISSYPEPHCFAGSVFQHPISLKVLRICDCPRLQSLRELGFQQLTSLVELGIIKCCELQSLTEVGLQHLTSLEKLNIQWCSKLQYLTKQRLPDSLSYLHVYDFNHVSLLFLGIPVTKCSLFCTNQVDHLLKVLTTARNFCIFPVVVKMIIDINVMDPISECGYGSQKKT